MTFFPLHNTVQFHISISTGTKSQYTPKPMILKLCAINEKRNNIENCRCMNACYILSLWNI